MIDDKVCILWNNEVDTSDHYSMMYRLLFMKSSSKLKYNKLFEINV